MAKYFLSKKLLLNSFLTDKNYSNTAWVLLLKTLKDLVIR